MNFLNKLVDLIHRIPHFDIHFRRTSNIFNYDVSSQYFQSLVVFSLATALIGLLLLLIIVITWICQCCKRKDDNQRTRKSVRNLTITLFVLSIICFIFLSACFYGNEHVNRSVGKSVNGLEDVQKNLKQASHEWGLLSESQENASRHVDGLVRLIDRKTQESPHINKTLLEELDSELTLVSDRVDDVKSALNRINITLSDVKKIEKAKLYADRFEFERWILLIILPSIVTIVLFAGVISFCLQSKKGSVTFSALSFVTFIVTWILISLVVPITIGHLDLCSSNDEFIRGNLRPEFYKSYLFYKTCKPTEEHKSVPPELPFNELNKFYKQMETGKTKLVGIVNQLFNNTADIIEETDKISDDITQSYKHVGAIESTLSCFSMHDDIIDIHTGICHNAIIGSLIMLLSFWLVGIFTFVLLLIVSKSWYMFDRLPSDYIEVGEDDPFFPRQTDTVIPADVYGTHVFNHRSHFNNIDQNDSSAANNILNQQNSQTTPLLDSTWQRNATAPSGNNTISAATGNRFI